jgi:hypothetical protein
MDQIAMTTPASCQDKSGCPELFRTDARWGWIGQLGVYCHHITDNVAE